MDAARFRIFLFFALLALVLGLTFRLLAPFLPMIAWAILLAVLAWPMHRQLEKRIRQPELAAALSCLLVVLVVLLPVALVATHTGRELVALAQRVESSPEVRTFLQGGRLQALPLVGDLYRWLERDLGLSPELLESAIQQAVARTSAFVARQSVGVAKNLVIGVAQVALTLVTLFFLLRDARRALAALRAFLPLDSEESDALLRRIAETIRATVFGQTVVAVTQGTLGGLAFWALGLPSPLLWGVVMTVLCLLPLLGAPVVWLPAAITLFVQGHTLRAIALVLWGALVVGLVDNFLRPIVIGARTRLHPLLVFFCAFGGLLLMGPLGLFLGPVLLAIALALLERVGHRLRERG
jgi:predicted PurR-regulated permease PerM